MPKLSQDATAVGEQPDLAHSSGQSANLHHAEPFGKAAKRSVRLNGHRTSITLEPAFAAALADLAARRGLSINALVAAVDADRADPSESLSSRLRVTLLEAALHREI